MNELAIYEMMDVVSEIPSISKVTLTIDDFERTVKGFGGHRIKYFKMYGLIMQYFTFKKGTYKNDC